MRNYLALTKVLLKTGFQTAQSNASRRKKTSKYGVYLLYFFLLLCFLPLMAMLYGFGSALYTFLAPVGQQALGLQLITYAGSFVVLLFALPYTLSTFFLANDLLALLPLPLKPWQILGAKFSAVAVYEYLFVLLMVAPMLLGYGVAAQASFLFWLESLLSLLLLPLTPLVYAALLSILLMRLLKNFKNKEALTTIGTLLLVAVVVLGSQLISGAQVQGQQLANTVLANQEVLNKINYMFPNLPLLQHALAEQNLLWLLAYALSAAAFVVVFLLCGNWLYFGGVMNMREAAGKRKALSAKEQKAFYRQRSPRNSYLRKELRLLIRTPAYLLNCLLTPFWLPLLMLVPIAISIWRLPSDNLEGLLLTFAYVPPDQIMAVGLLVIYGIAVLLAGCNYTLNTCISREGSGFAFMKYIPTPYRQQLQAKLLSGYLPSLLAMFPYLFLCMLGLVVWGNVSWLVFVLGFAIAALTALWISYLQLWADLHSPKLDWENEQAAVKNNFSAIIALFTVYASGIVIGVAAFFAYQALPLNIYAAAILFCLVLAILCYALREAVYRYGVRRLEEIEP